MINKNILKTCKHKKISEKELYSAYKIFFGTLVSESRLKIINLLRKKSLNVSEIIKKTGVEQTIISHDLQRLKKCGFVNSNQKGKFVYYKLNQKTINPLMKLIDKHMCKNCVHILRSKNEYKGGKKK